MLNKLRRKSKDSTQAVATQRTTTTGLSITTPKIHKGLNLFDLPAEIRNVIYELCASTTSLVVSDLKKTTCPTLLLTSHQVRREYAPVLLASAPIAVNVSNFDFRPTSRLIGSLFSTELKALRANSRLTINLHITKLPNKDDIAHLRRWATRRSEHMDRLAWTYKINRPKSMTRSLAQQRAELLGAIIKAIEVLHSELHESLQFELEPVLAVLEEEQLSLEWEAFVKPVTPAAVTPYTRMG